MKIVKRFFAEFLATAILVLSGCGAFFGSLLLVMVMWAWKTGVSGANGVASFFFTNTGAEVGKNNFMGWMLATMAEMGLTFFFVFSVLGVTSKKEEAK